MSKNRFFFRIGWYGFTFFVVNPTYAKLLGFKSFQVSVDSVSDAYLIEYFESDSLIRPLLDKGDHDVTIIYDNAFSTFVPPHLFEESLLRDYLKYTLLLSKDDVVLCDISSKSDLFSVYVPFTKMRTCFLNLLEGGVKERHYSSVLIDRVFSIKSDAPDTIFIDLQDQYFRLIVVSGNALKFYNTFLYISENDFIYFVLAVLDQFQIRKDTAKLVFIDDTCPFFNNCLSIAKKYLPVVIVENTVNNTLIDVDRDGADLLRHSTFLSYL